MTSSEGRVQAAVRLSRPRRQKARFGVARRFGVTARGFEARVLLFLSSCGILGPPGEAVRGSHRPRWT